MNKNLTRAVLTAAIVAGGAVSVGSVVAQASDDGIADTSTEPVGLQTLDDVTVDDTDGEQRDGRGCNDDAVAEALGITTDELSVARESGMSIADIAAAQGVEIDAVVDAIVDGRAERLDAKVASGDLTADEAQERLDRAEDSALDRVVGDETES